MKCLSYKKWIIRKDFIAVRIVGGIGNQLFTLFFGLAVSSYLRTQLIVEDKLILFGSNSQRRNEIIKFEFEKFLVVHKKSRLSKVVVILNNKFVRKVFWHLIHLPQKVVNENDVNNTKFKFEKNKIYSGYFQSWFYADLLYELSSGFDIKVLNPSSEYEELAFALINDEPICVHVRLGDYLDFPDIYSILPENYFLSVIDIFLQSGNSKVWVFVEDSTQLISHYPELSRVCDKIIDRNYGITDSESFSLLTKCNKLITSNSTFSLWAAWFVEKNQGRAVIPLQLGVIGEASELVSSRWDRYDLISNAIIPNSDNRELYSVKKLEFEKKFI